MSRVGSQTWMGQVGKQLLLIVWIGMLPGCGDGGTPPTETVVRDSSGVTIVENAPMSGEPVVRWEPSPAQILVGVPGGGEEHELYRVAGVARLEDGAVAVLNGVPPEVRLFDRDGTLLWKAGGSGRGPGEFVSPAVLQRLEGDSLVVYDPPIQRFTVLSPEGEVVRTVSSDGRIASFIGFVIDDLAISSQGTIRLIAGRTPDRPQEENARIIERVHVSTGDRDTVTVVRGEEMFFSVTDGEGGVENVSQFRVPFTVPPSITVSRRLLYVLDPQGGAVETYDDRGRLVRIIRTSEPPRSVERSDREQFVDGLIERLSNPDRAEAVRRAHEQMSLPGVMPLYDRILADGAGRSWVRRYDPLDTGHSVWLIFDRDGRLMGEVMLPGELEVRDVRGGVVTGTRTDEMDVESVIELRVDPLIEDRGSTSRS